MPQNMIGIYDQHAWLYDAAFSWDVTEEVAWLSRRLGAAVASVLEPACGSGRILLGFARAGLVVAGFDRSPAMLGRARARFREAGLPPPALCEAELADCDSLPFGRRFDGAVLPVGSFAYLRTDDDARRHLAGIARHLIAGARYLVQLDLRRLSDFELRSPGPTCCWDTPHPRGTVRCTVFGKSFDPDSRIETEVSRYELVDGPDAGFCHESEHAMRVWDWESWRGLIATSPFLQVEAYDGNAAGCPPLEMGSTLEGRPLVWHELALLGDSAGLHRP